MRDTSTFYNSFVVKINTKEMCILFVFADPNPQESGYRLIIVSNRDEFYNRPSEAISRTKDVIGGRDLFEGRAGGMWLGISLASTEHADLRFGALLNVTGEDRKQGLKGRGFIVTDYLEGEIEAKEYMDALLSSEESYNAFNFVALETKNDTSIIHHCSNTPRTYTKSEGKQILGYGNTVPTSPPTKVVKGTERFKEIVERHNAVEQKEVLIDELLKLLKWDKQHLPCPELQRRQPQFYGFLACIYVKCVAVDYGTRTHSIILVDDKWNVEFYEATMKEPIDPENPIWVTDTISAKL